MKDLKKKIFLEKDVFSINDIDEYAKIKGNDKEYIYIKKFRKWINSQKYKIENRRLKIK